MQTQIVNTNEELIYWREYHHFSEEPNFNTVQLPPMPSMIGFSKCLISVSSVNFKNAIRTLKSDDYITINNIKYIINRNMSNLTPGRLIVVLSEVLNESGITVSLTETNIVRFYSNTDPFTINDMSYNLRLLTGIHKLPITAEEGTHTYTIISNQFGDYNSTPIFFLLSDICISGSGSGMFIKNISPDGFGTMASQNIFMKINNTHAPERDIAFSGGDVKYYSDTGVLGRESTIQLVDANLQPVDLLSPMRLSIYVEFVS